MFKKVGSLIKLSPKYNKSQGSISAIMIRQIAKQALSDMLRDYPEDLVKKIKPTVYKNGTLNVECPSTASAELYMRSGELIAAVNHKVGLKILKNIRFKNS